MTQSSPILQVRRFAELGGFVVLDVAAVLAQWVDDETSTHDLLPRLSDEAAVEQLAASQGLLPIVVEPPDDIALAVYLDAQQPPDLDTVLGDEQGWALRAGDRGQHLLAIGYLMRWHAASDDAVPLTLPPGNYIVRARWGLRAGAPALDLLVTSQTVSEPRELPITAAFE